MPALPHAGPPGIRPIPIAEFREKVLGMYQPPKMSRGSFNTIRHALDTLARTPGAKTTADLGPELVTRFEKTWEGNQTTTLRDAIYSLRRICNLAVEMGHLVESPFTFDPFPKVARNPNPEPKGRALTPDEVARLVEHVRAKASSWKGWRLYALVCTALHTDLFKTEQLYLKPGDYDAASGTIRVTSGRRAGVETAAPDVLKEVLAGWLPLAGSHWVFPNSASRATPWTSSNYPYGANHHVRQAGIDVGIAGLNLESLRLYRGPDFAGKIRKKFGAKPAGRVRALIVLGKNDEPPEVLRVKCDKVLSAAEYDIVRALLSVFPDGLSWPELEKASGRPAPRTTVKRLKAKGAVWDKLLLLPSENSHGDCRIAAS